MSVKIQPLANYVVAAQEEAATKTASGILLTPGSEEKPKTAKILAVGKDVKQVKAGDRVIYKSDYSTTSIKVSGEDYILIKEEDLLAIVK